MTPKPVSRIIKHVSHGFLYVRCKGQTVSNITSIRAEVLFRGIPKTKYRVTYTPDRKGKYLVDRGHENGLRRIAKYEKGLTKSVGNRPNMLVCFLPPEYRGLRVNRKVERL